MATRSHTVSTIQRKQRRSDTKPSRTVTDEELRLAFEALADGAEVITVETFAQKLKDFKVHNFRELVGDTGELTF